MKSRVILTIGGEEYTLLADENEEYIKKTAALVDDKMKELSGAPALSKMNIAVLAALNIADDYLKAMAACDNMRTQMKNYLDDAAQLRSELSAAKKEIARLRGR